LAVAGLARGVGAHSAAWALPCRWNLQSIHSLRSGEFETVRPGWKAKALPISAAYASRRHLSLAVRTLKASFGSSNGVTNIDVTTQLNILDD